MEPTGLDHDDGIDGLSTERSLVLRRKGQYLGGIPVFAMAQMQKDKNQQMLNVRCALPPPCFHVKTLSFLLTQACISGRPWTDQGCMTCGMRHHNYTLWSSQGVVHMTAVNWQVLALQDRWVMVFVAGLPCLADQHDGTGCDDPRRCSFDIPMQGSWIGVKMRTKIGAQADVEASVYHNARLVSTGALDVMTTQRDLIYTARAETRIKIHPRDKAALGITIARLVEEGGPPTKARALPRIAVVHVVESGAVVSALGHGTSGTHTPELYGGGRGSLH